MELTSGLKLKIYKHGEKKDHQLARFIYIYLILNAVNSMIQTTFGVSGTALQTIRIVMYVVIFLALLAGFFTLSRAEQSCLIMAEIIVGITYLFSMLIGGVLRQQNG